MQNKKHTSHSKILSCAEFQLSCAILPKTDSTVVYYSLCTPSTILIHVARTMWNWFCARSTRFTRDRTASNIHFAIASPRRWNRCGRRRLRRYYGDRTLFRAFDRFLHAWWARVRTTASISVACCAVVICTDYIQLSNQPARSRATCPNTRSSSVPRSISALKEETLERRVVWLFTWNATEGWGHDEPI